jgi:hypothetical protein
MKSTLIFGAAVLAFASLPPTLAAAIPMGDDAPTAVFERLGIGSPLVATATKNPYPGAPPPPGSPNRYAAGRDAATTFFSRLETGGPSVTTATKRPYSNGLPPPGPPNRYTSAGIFEKLETGTTPMPTATKNPYQYPPTRPNAPNRYEHDAVAPVGMFKKLETDTALISTTNKTPFSYSPVLPNAPNRHDHEAVSPVEVVGKFASRTEPPIFTSNRPGPTSGGDGTGSASRPRENAITKRIVAVARRLQLLCRDSTFATSNIKPEILIFFLTSIGFLIATSALVRMVYVKYLQKPRIPDPERAILLETTPSGPGSWLSRATVPSVALPMPVAPADVVRV